MRPTAPLPVGTVTFLFTDIEGSTRLLRDLGEAYTGLLAEHHRILREAVTSAGGVAVGSEGDSLFAVFASASKAVRAAVDAQRCLAAQPWPDEVTVRVRRRSRCSRRPATCPASRCSSAT